MLKKGDSLALDNITFEEGIARLEEIVEELDKNNTTLDNALDLFEEGINLIKCCSNLLDSAEAKVKILREDTIEELKTEKIEIGE